MSVYYEGCQKVLKHFLYFNQNQKEMCAVFSVVDWNTFCTSIKVKRKYVLFLLWLILNILLAAAAPPNMDSALNLEVF